MERIIKDITTDVQRNGGLRVITIESAAIEDRLVLELKVLRKEDTALYDEPPCHEVTGNVCLNGQLADELSHLLSRLNLARPFTTLS